MIGTLQQQWSQLARKQRAVLCSVVQWKGSVPRKDYPLMLVLEDGSILGTIGGGSMELKVTRSALEMMDQSEPAVFEFDMTGTDLQADVGLCGGSLKVLVESFTVELQQFYADLVKNIAVNPRLMVLLSIHPGAHLRVQRHLVSQASDLKNLPEEARRSLDQSFKTGKTRSFDADETQFLLWQPFSPPDLHIFGAGHVGQAVADLAHFSEITSHIYDDRLELLTTDRFPHAQLHVTSFPIVWEDLPRIPDNDFILIASREHKHDRELLAGLLQSSRAYVGLVSSARKWELLSRSLLEEGLALDVIARVHAPVGLSIEAQTVPEIAVSILAEMIAEYRRVRS